MGASINKQKVAILTGASSGVSEAILETCFPCHEPDKARDFVLTHYAP